MERERLEAFTGRFLDACVIDEDIEHHEFSGGMHGTKIRAEQIKLNSPLGDEWIQLHAETIAERYRPLPNMILGVAHGTNVAARLLAEELGHGVWDIHTVKKEGELPKLAPGTDGLIKDIDPELIVIFDDVLTEGTNTAPLAISLLEAGAKRVVVEVTAQRLEHAVKLDEIGVAYNSLINVRQRLPTYTPEECEEFGLCAKEIKLIPRSDRSTLGVQHLP